MNLNLLNLLRKTYSILRKLPQDRLSSAVVDLRKINKKYSREPITLARPIATTTSRDPVSTPGDRKPLHPTPQNDLDVKVSYITRTGSREDFTIVPTTWTNYSKNGIESRVCERYIYKQGISFLVQWEQFFSVDATRITVSPLNAIKDAGPFYYKSMSITTKDSILLNHRENGVFLPGGVYPFRCYEGPEVEKLLGYLHLKLRNPERWIADKCLEGMKMMDTKLCGPFEIAFPSVQGNSALNGSHGGWNIGPFQGGPDCWTKGTPEGWMYKEDEMITVARRSAMVKMDESGNFVRDPKEGWPGRTWEHEKKGWRWTPTLVTNLTGWTQKTDGKCYTAEGDDLPRDYFWCSYEQELHEYRAMDHTHYHRMTRAAAMLAPQDAFARWFIRACWNDLANWLDTDGGSNNQYLYNLDELIEKTPRNQGSWWGGRGWAHTLRAFLYAEPYLTREESVKRDGKAWRSALRNSILHIVNPRAVLHRMEGDHYVGMENVICARAREIDLMGPNFLAFDLPEIDADWKHWCRPVDGTSIGVSVELQNGDNWSEGAYAYPNYYPGYDGIRGLYTEFGTPEATEIGAKSRDIFENPYDYHYRVKTQ